MFMDANCIITSIFTLFEQFAVCGRRCSVYFAPLPFFKKFDGADITEAAGNVISDKNFDTQKWNEKILLGKQLLDVLLSNS